jgi:hypothetical protein
MKRCRMTRQKDWNETLLNGIAERLWNETLLNDIAERLWNETLLNDKAEIHCWVKFWKKTIE